MVSLQAQLTSLSDQVAAIAEFLLGDGQPTSTAPRRNPKPTGKAKPGRSRGEAHSAAIKAGKAAARDRQAKEAKAKARAAKKRATAKAAAK